MSLPTKQYRVLVVDDEPLVARACQILLKRSGYDALVVDNGMAALEMLKSESFDVIITDFYMPGFSGDELVDEVKRQNPSQRVILSSGQYDTADRLTKRERKPDLVLTKPYQFTDLVAGIQKILSLPCDFLAQKAG